MKIPENVKKEIEDAIDAHIEEVKLTEDVVATSQIVWAFRAGAVFGSKKGYALASERLRSEAPKRGTSAEFWADWLEAQGEKDLVGGLNNQKEGV